MSSTAFPVAGIAISTSSQFPWTVITGTSQTMSANNGYFSNNVSAVTFTLPGTASVGATFLISGLGSGGWIVGQGSGQNINFGSAQSTTGVGGSVASTNEYDCIWIVCAVANTTFNIINSIGEPLVT